MPNPGIDNADWASGLATAATQNCTVDVNIAGTVLHVYIFPTAGQPAAYWGHGSHVHIIGQNGVNLRRLNSALLTVRANSSSSTAHGPVIPAKNRANFGSSMTTRIFTDVAIPWWQHPPDGSRNIFAPPPDGTWTAELQTQYLAAWGGLLASTKAICDAWMGEGWDLRPATADLISLGFSKEEADSVIQSTDEA